MRFAPSLLVAHSLLIALSASAPAQVRFTDVTVDAGLLPALGLGATVDAMRGGAAAADFDRDGHVDLFVLGRGLRPDALFWNDGDGTFTDRARVAGVALSHQGGGVCVGDYDSDGWLDLFVTSAGGGDLHGAGQVGRHLLWRNQGDRTFTNVAQSAGVARTSPVVPDGFGCAFGDYDLDGDLDLFATGWVQHLRPSLGNRLFQNQGDGTFRDVTKDAKLDLDPLAGFTPSFVDMDGDRYPELLFVADFGGSRYFLNARDGTFRDATSYAGVSLETNGMGSAVADFDNDGRLDWYVTSIELDGFGSVLYSNLGGHRYRETALQSGVGLGGWGWGTAALDVDLDGWLDLLATNGFPHPPHDGERSYLWRNQGGASFTPIADDVGFVHEINGLGVVRFDLEGDGDEDVLITAAHFAQMRLYRNDQTTGRHWLRVALDTSLSSGLAPDGFGSKIRVRTGDRWQLRSIDGGSSYLCTHEPIATFGLGDTERVDELVVEWSDGRVSRQFDLATDRLVVVASD